MARCRITWRLSSHTPSAYLQSSLGAPPADTRWQLPGHTVLSCLPSGSFSPPLLQSARMRGRRLRGSLARATFSSQSTRPCLSHRENTQCSGSSSVRTAPVGTVTFSFTQVFRRLLRGLPWHVAVAAPERRVLRMREQRTSESPHGERHLPS